MSIWLWVWRDTPPHTMARGIKIAAMSHGTVYARLTRGVVRVDHEFDAAHGEDYFGSYNGCARVEDILADLMSAESTEVRQR